MAHPAPNAAPVADPRKSLTANQLTLLRQLDQFGPASKVRGGWMLAGNFRRASTFEFATVRKLAIETFEHGKHKLRVDFAGRALLDDLAPPTRTDMAPRTPRQWWNEH